MSVVRLMMQTKLAANQLRRGAVNCAQQAQPIAKPLRNLCVFPAPRNHCPGVLTSSRVRSCNLCTTLLSSRPRACPAMQPAAAVSLVCWAQARGAPACFGAATLSRPVRPEACLQPNQYVIFCYHLDIPINGVLFYRKFCTATREVPVGV